MNSDLKSSFPLSCGENSLLITFLSAYFLLVFQCLLYYIISSWLTMLTFYFLKVKAKLIFNDDVLLYIFPNYIALCSAAQIWSSTCIICLLVATQYWKSIMISNKKWFKQKHITQLENLFSMTYDVAMNCLISQNNWQLTK